MTFPEVVGPHSVMSLRHQSGRAVEVTMGLKDGGTAFVSHARLGIGDNSQLTDIAMNVARLRG